MTNETGHSAMGLVTSVIGVSVTCTYTIYTKYPFPFRIPGSPMTFISFSPFPSRIDTSPCASNYSPCNYKLDDAIFDGAD
jgi:hypothetical protein